VGGLRTALYNYLFAKKNGGDFLLRIEDTDQKRSVPGAEGRILEALTRARLVPDEGLRFGEGRIESVGEKGPYRQSERTSLYRKHAEDLVEKGLAYRCFCTEERLAALREEQQQRKEAPRYDRKCAVLSREESAKRTESESFVIRLSVPEGKEIVFEDAVRGEIRFRSDEVDDQVLLKADGFPTYHLANVVDDHLMGITHVIRGEEWLPSTPKHILLYEAFGWESPVFAHIPLLLNPGGGKLSKRQGDVAVHDFYAKGYLPEALVNFVALLGWNPGQGNTQEIFSLDELASLFDLGQVHKGGAVFDQKKLDWMNGEYIKRLALGELYARAEEGGFLESPLIKNAPADLRSEEAIKRVLAVEQERLVRLDGIGVENPFFFQETLEYPGERLAWKTQSPAETRVMLERAHTLLSEAPAVTWQELSALENLLLSAAGEKRGDFLWPLRVALSGAEKSPSPFALAFVLGKERSLERLEMALERLSLL
jgi:glutamyl-tRNA synthetase